MGTGAFDITGATSTDWQLAGGLRINLDRDLREVLDDEGGTIYATLLEGPNAGKKVPYTEEVYMKTVSFSRFRDWENISAVAMIFSDADGFSGLAIPASLQGTAQIDISVSPEYDASDPTSGTQPWFLQDTNLEPMESQGSKFIRETQEWYAKLPDWVSAPWQAFPE